MAARRTSQLQQAASALALVAAWLLTAPVARAELNLKWDAPPGCPAGSEVQDRIRALAGSSLDKTEGLSAEGTITPANGRFQLTLLVRDGHDVRRRVISSDSCADLAGAAAISLALLLGIDVSASATQADDRTPGETPKDQASGEAARSTHDDRAGEDRRTRSEKPAERNPAPSATPAPRRWNLLVRAPILAADLGPLPRPSLGAGLGVGMRYASWSVLVAGYAYLAQTVEAETGSEFGTGADLKRKTLAITLCRGWRSYQFEIAPCLGVGLEHLTARGFGEGVSPESRRTVWAAPSAGAFVHWYALKSLALFGGVTGYLELARPRLVVEGLGEVRQLAPAAAGATVGLEWIL